MHWPLAHRNWVDLQPKCLCAKSEYIMQVYMQVQVLTIFSVGLQHVRTPVNKSTRKGIASLFGTCKYATTCLQVWFV